MTEATSTAEATAPAAAPAPASTPAAPAASPTPAAAPAPAATPVASPAPSPAATPAAAPEAAPAAAPAAPAAAPAPAAVGAPEAYDFKSPEGSNAFNPVVLSTFGEVAKSLNLPQEGAQAILDKVAPVIQAQQMEALTEFYADLGGMPDTWAATTKADKEIGGPNLEENLAISKKARDLGGPEFVNLLNKTGLGNHPAVIKTFLRIGKSLSEEKFIGGGSQNGGAALSVADRLYGKKT